MNSPLELLPVVRDELGLCDSKDQDFVAWDKSLPGPSPSCSRSLGCMNEKAWFAGEALSPPWRTLATPPAQPSLAAPGKLFTLRFSQVATNYTLAAFPGAPCKAPEPDVPEFRMLRATATALRPGYLPHAHLGAPCSPGCPVPSWVPWTPRPALGRALITMALCCPVLLPPCSHLLPFSKAVSLLSPALHGSSVIR